MSITYDALNKFADTVASSFRYVLDENGAKLIDFLKLSINDREITLPPMTHFYRAQRDFSKERHGDNPKLLVAHDLKRMIPDPTKVGAGRINPKGIAYIYLTDSPSSAIYEMRPWIGDILSVAHFVSDQQLRLADLTSDNEDSVTMKNLFNRALPSTKEEIESQIWSDLNRAFSKPVNSNNDCVDYAPTQIIAEWINGWGFDGVKYKSSVHPKGMNFALFDRNIFTKMESCELYTINYLKYGHHQTNSEMTRHSKNIDHEEL